MLSDLEKKTLTETVIGAAQTCVRSKTFWGIVGMGLSKAGKFFGFMAPDVSTIADFASGALALYGARNSRRK